jgi:hypothetical protein
VSWVSAVTVLASFRTFELFRSKYQPAKGFRQHIADAGNDNDPVAVAWRSWITHIFMPQNRRMAEVVLGTADLIEGDEIPRCFLDLCAHVAAYEALVLAWESGDFSEHWNMIDFPGAELYEYSATHFFALKREQARLLGQIAPDIPPLEVQRSTDLYH